MRGGACRLALIGYLQRVVGESRLNQALVANCRVCVDDHDHYLC